MKIDEVDLKKESKREDVFGNKMENYINSFLSKYEMIELHADANKLNNMNSDAGCSTGEKREGKYYVGKENGEKLEIYLFKTMEEADSFAYQNDCLVLSMEYLFFNNIALM